MPSSTSISLNSSGSSFYIDGLTCKKLELMPVGLASVVKRRSTLKEGLFWKFSEILSVSIYYDELTEPYNLSSP